MKHGQPWVHQQSRITFITLQFAEMKHKNQLKKITEITLDD